MSTRIKYMLPRAENLLKLVNQTIVSNLLRRREAKITLPPLIERAYMIVNETGTLPFQRVASETTPEETV